MSKKRKTYISSDDEDDYIDNPPKDGKNGPQKIVVNVADVRDVPHSKSVHVLDGPTATSIQSKLTTWFLDGVHEKRGMPWRKPWDPSLSSSERAQRAYEVRFTIVDQPPNSLELAVTWPRSLISILGVGFRNYAAADEGRDGHSVL